MRIITIILLIFSFPTFAQNEAVCNALDNQISFYQENESIPADTKESAIASINDSKVRLDCTSSVSQTTDYSSSEVVTGEADNSSSPACSAIDDQIGFYSENENIPDSLKGTIIGSLQNSRSQVCR